MSRQSNHFDRDGRRWGVRYQDGSITDNWTGRTQRQQAEKFITSMNEKNYGWASEGTLTLVFQTEETGETWFTEAEYELASLSPEEKLNMLPGFVLGHEFFVAELEKQGTSGDGRTIPVDTPATALQSNIVSSRVGGTFPVGDRRHRLLIDIDMPARLIPSSKPEHWHLYVDKEIPEPAYFRLLDVLAECGLIEEGYAQVSKRRGYTALRVPWVKKKSVARRAGMHAYT